MKKLLLTAAAIFVVTPAQAQDFNDAQKAQIGEIIKEYLMENPSVVIEAATAHQENMAAAEADKAQAAIKENIAAMTAEDAPSIGASAADADVTVVEFFDYNCGYCKRAIPDIQAVLKDDPKVRFVFREMPILGPTSRLAASYALAAQKQGKYFDYHVALMEHRGPKNEESLSKIGADLGLDVDQLKADAGSEEISQAIEEDTAFGRAIGINGTPAFIVGDQLFPGYLGPQGLKDSIKEARAAE